MKAQYVLLIGAAILSSLGSVAKADEWDQKTVFTFNVPVEIPGQVLGPGTYVFKLADSTSDRNIVQVFNQRENHLYGTFLTIPDYRSRPSGKTIITFDERTAGSPEAVKAWFYPGENYGHDFVYPKLKALALAKVNQAPVPSMPTELEPNTTMPATTMQEPHVVAMKTAELTAQQPTEEEVEISEAFPVELPKTAGSGPLVLLLGLISLATAGGLRFVSAKSR